MRSATTRSSTSPGCTGSALAQLEAEVVRTQDAMAQVTGQGR